MSNPDFAYRRSEYWLSGRWFDATLTTSSWTFGVRIVNGSAHVNGAYKSVVSCDIYTWDGSKFVEKLFGRTIRSIITLRSDVHQQVVLG